MIPYSRTLKQNPQALILDIFSKKRDLTAKRAYEFFIAKYEPGISVQGFYKLIRQLLRDRVLVKNEGALSLDVSWINNLVKFTDTIKTTYSEGNTGKTVTTLEDGESSTFSFADVIEMDNFWDHTMLLVIRYYQNNKHADKNIYSQNFYSWIQVIRTQSTIELANSYAEFGLDWYMTSGSHSLLNSLVPHLVTSDNFHFSLSKNGKQDNFHVTVIGDFIFETKLPPHLFDMVKEMFEDTKSLSDLATKKVEEEMHKSAKTGLKITRDKRRAAEIRNNIKKSF